MPWRGPEVPGEYPTLGFAVGEWIEEHCVIPDGDHVGEAYRLTDEMWRFLLWFYRLDPDTGRFAYARGGQLVEPQKWGKGPFGSAVICAEADGPVIPAGWDSSGDPVGRPWTTPWIQVAAVSEGQTDNVWRSLQPMIELGRLAGDITDTGITRINLPDGGLIEPVTSSAGSRLGQRVTFVLQDETHSWTKANGGRALADTQRRNVAGMGGRWLETTNAWDPNESSVAQETAEIDAAAGDVYRQHPEPAETVRLSNQRDRRRILKLLYGQSWWVDRDRIEVEVVALLRRDPAQAERFFANRSKSSQDDWMDVEAFDAAADPDIVVEPGEMVALGFDGSLGTMHEDRVPDSTVLRGCRISDGHLFTVGLWEAPGPGPWEPPHAEVDRTVDEAFDTWRVVVFYGDPPHWQNYLGAWQDRHGDQAVVQEWWTNRDVAMARALERLHTALTQREASHDGDPRVRDHYRHARRLVKRSATADPDGRRERVLVRKPHPNSPLKIDAVPADALAMEARADAIANGLHRKPEQSKALYAY